MVAPGLYPRSGPRPTSSEAERTFYRELSAQLPEGWIAWHSLRFRNDSGEEGEGDFVIVAPDSTYHKRTGYLNKDRFMAFVAQARAAPHGRPAGPRKSR